MSADSRSDEAAPGAAPGAGPAAGPAAAHRADLELVRRALDGRREARAELAGRLEVTGRVLAARNARLGRPLADADLADLVQDVVLLVWRKLATYEGRAALETWIHRFCTLELMNRLRRDARRPRSLDEAPEPAIEPQDGPPDTAAAAADEEVALARLVRHLAPREAEIVRLRHEGGLTLAEAGAALGISASSAKTHYYRALDKLRALLTPKERR